MKLMLVAMVVCSTLFSISLTQENPVVPCTLRSPIGDVIYNTSSDAQCDKDGNLTGVDFQMCLEESTFLSGNHCCVQDQRLNEECGLKLVAEVGNMSSSTIPVVLTTDTTNLLMIIVGNTTAQVAMIYDTNSSDIVTDCIPVREITMPTSGKLLEEQITFNHTNGTIQVMSTGLNYTDSGLYKLNLQCNTTRGGSSEKQCIFFKLITSRDQYVYNITDLNGLNESTIPQCNSPITTTTTTTSSETTRDTTHVTTLENPTTNSIWEMYNKLLVYVVVGAGCALGLLLIFIVMLCLLTGCVANKRRRYRVQRKHQLETAPSQGRAANPQRRSHVQCERNTSYILQTTNTPEDIPDGGAIEDTSPTVQNTTSSQTHPHLVKVEIPIVPQIHLQQTDNIEDVTFDSFKRLSPKKTEVKEPSRDEPSSPVAATLDSYYETVTPVRPDPKQNPTETYDTLIHKGGPQPLTNTKHFTLPTVNSQYSHLNTNTEKSSPLTVSNSFEPDRSYSLVTPRGRRNNCMSPPPLPPPLALNDDIELLNLNDFSRKDIFTSSWSQPCMIDKFKPGDSEILEVYDHPTSLDLVPPKLLTHEAAMETEDEWENIEYLVEEPIYDVPPPQSPEHDRSSIGSYVDMQGGLSIYSKYGQTP